MSKQHKLPSDTSNLPNTKRDFNWECLVPLPLQYPPPSSLSLFFLYPLFLRSHPVLSLLLIKELSPSECCPIHFSCSCWKNTLHTHPYSSVTRDNTEEVSLIATLFGLLWLCTVYTYVANTISHYLSRLLSLRCHIGSYFAILGAI